MRRTRRVSLAVTLSSSVLVLALAGCSGGAEQPGSGGSGGASDTLTLGQTADIQGYSPAIQPTYQGWLPDAIWDGLLQCDENGEASASIADTWEISPDNTSATFHIRDGITFSDGSAVEADDVQASAELAATANARFEGVTFQVDDPANFTMTFPEVQPLMNLRLCEMLITSKDAIDSGSYEQNPIGTGPYVLDADGTTRGSTYTVTKRADAWDASTYPFQKVVFKVLESETAGINALKTGQIDGVLASAATIDEVEASGLQSVSLRGATTRLLLTDHNGVTVPALGDVRVRQAMNMVFDRDAIASQLYRGKADPAYQIFREGTEAYIDGLEDPYPFDVAKAKQLMSDAGYADGFDLQIPTMAGQNHELLIPYVTEALAQINIRVTEVPQTGPDAIANILSGTYPVPLWQLGNYGDSRQDILDYVLPSGIWNVSHQDDATVAELWQKVLNGTDEEKAQAQKDLNQYVIDQAWFVPMAYPDGFYAYSNDISVPKVSDFAQLHPLLRDFQQK